MRSVWFDGGMRETEEVSLGPFYDGELEPMRRFRLVL